MGLIRYLCFLETAFDLFKMWICWSLHGLVVVFVIFLSFISLNERIKMVASCTCKAFVMTFSIYNHRVLLVFLDSYYLLPRHQFFFFDFVEREEKELLNNEAIVAWLWHIIVCLVSWSCSYLGLFMDRDHEFQILK